MPRRVGGHQPRLGGHQQQYPSVRPNSSIWEAPCDDGARWWSFSSATPSASP